MVKAKKKIRRTDDELGYLLDIDYILDHTKPPLESLKVTLKKDPIKGTGLFAQKFIAKGETISYYKMRVYSQKHPGPFGNMYLFFVYDRKEEDVNGVIGNLFEKSVPQPRRGIPYWAYFSNEPSGNQKSNSFIDINTRGNYRNRKKVKIGETIVYKLVAETNIHPGEEIVWCYGDDYDRNYQVSCL